MTFQSLVCSLFEFVNREQSPFIKFKYSIGKIALHICFRSESNKSEVHSAFLLTHASTQWHCFLHHKSNSVPCLTYDVKKLQFLLVLLLLLFSPSFQLIHCVGIFHCFLPKKVLEK